MKLKRKNKDIQIRNCYKDTELFQKVLKSLFLYNNDRSLQLIIHKYSIFKLSNETYKTRIKNYCIITGRSRGILRKFRISRILFKYLGFKGIFFGLRKAS